MRRLVWLLLCLTGTSLACRPSESGAGIPVPETSPERAPLQTTSVGERPTPAAVRLVLWITVDQLRADFLVRFPEHLGPGGFERLLREGASYPHARFTHAITETAPGHATLFTGASPAEHGIVSNGWLSRDTGTEVASVADPDAPLVGIGLSASPASTGRSPRQLLLPTVGDALTRATAGQAKVFAVSVKDRAAILPGGFSGKAFWIGASGFISSRYYYEELPAWVDAHNRRFPVSAYRGAWQLLYAPERYQRIELDDRGAERPAFGLGRTFPHPVTGEGEALTRAVVSTPFGDELTVSFALAVVAEERLGMDDVPDLLAVSLSSTDYVGHAFGPESLEAEDNFARLDRQIARLLDGVDAAVGLDRTLVVLSADHGACESAEHLASLGLPAARIEPGELLRFARAAATRHFGEPDLVLGFTNPSLWLNRALAAERNLEVGTVAAVLARALESRPDVYRAWPTAHLLAGEAEGAAGLPEPLSAVRHSLHPQRSGDVYVVPLPYSLLLQHADLAATHGSPWHYDANVPILVFGPGVPAGVHQRAAAPTELAATVARLVGIPAPAGASSDTLTELTSALPRK